MTITRTHYKDDLRVVCIRNKFCDMMTGDDYDLLLDLFEERGDDDSIVAMIARDIATHTAKFRNKNHELDRRRINEFTEVVAFEILNNACFYGLTL